MNKSYKIFTHGFSPVGAIRTALVEVLNVDWTDYDLPFLAIHNTLPPLSLLISIGAPNVFKRLNFQFSLQKTPSNTAKSNSSLLIILINDDNGHISWWWPGSVYDCLRNHCSATSLLCTGFLLLDGRWSVQYLSKFCHCFPSCSFKVYDQSQYFCLG